MRIDLSGKTAVITGSTKGIGLATAKAMAAAGAAVVVNGRSPERVEAAIEAVRSSAEGIQVRGVAADLGTVEGCDALVAGAPRADILVNNVGVYDLGDFFDTADGDWQKTFDVNVMSGVRLARAYMPGMLERDWGRVLFVSSESALNIPEDMIHYGVSKAAQLAVSRGLAKRAAGTGVTVNAVLPGPTLSEGVLDLLPEVEGKTPEQVAAAFVRKERASSIIRRAATVEEVAAMIVYAASPQASATTGAALRVDGGVVDTIA